MVKIFVTGKVDDAAKKTNYHLTHRFHIIEVFYYYLTYLLLT